MTKPITPEMSAAWRTLQRFVRSARADESLPEFCYEASDAIDVLDNSGFMVPVEDAAHEREIASPPSGHDCDQAPYFHLRCSLYTPPLDPAEWGDTTRGDLARHQGATGE